MLLTKPGTSGAYRYQYVGGLLWERQIDSANSVDGRLNAAAYGAVTPASGVPRSGSAAYSFDLIADQGQLANTGSGSMNIGFAAGTFSGSASTIVVQPTGATTPGQNFLTSGTISSNANALNGTFSIGPSVNGNLTGRFYGPAGEELGAAFYTTGTSIPTVGFLIGRRAGAATSNLSLTDLQVDQTFGTLHMENAYNASTANVTSSLGGRAVRSLAYGATSKVWAYTDLNSTVYNFTDVQKTAATGRFIVYENGAGRRLMIYRPGTGNPEVALTYGSFAVLERRQAADVVNYEIAPFGIFPTSLPLSGTASYSGRLYGQGASAVAAYELGGTANLTISFLASGGNVSGSFNPIGQDVVSGRSIDFGNYEFSGGVSMQSTTAVFQAFSSSTIGFMDGYVFGPNAEELISTFGLVRGTDPNFAGQTVTLAGVIYTKKN